MTAEERKAQLDAIFAPIDQSTRDLIEPLLNEVVFMEERLLGLRKLPLIGYNVNNPVIQRHTPAAKQYKECSQSYMNAIRILAGILKRSEPTAADDLIKRLEEFEM